MARTLGQVAGVMMAIRKKDGDVGKELQKRIQAEALTTGLSKVFTPKTESSNEVENAALHARHPDKYKPVAVKAEDALREMMKYAVPAMDVAASVDRANQSANASIIIAGKPLVEDVPVSHLLWMVDYLGEWRKATSLLPVLNPTKNWTPLENGTFESDPEVTASNEKDLVPIVLHEGNDKHPPQVQLVQKDMIYVGKYTARDLSGAIPESRKKELLDRCDLVITAVKDAIARANQTPAPEIREGEIILGFLLA
jgi:hypothetical protein